MSLQTIAPLAIYVLFGLVILFGFLRGLRKGLYKSLVDIGFVVLGVILSLIISKLLARTLTDVSTLNSAIDTAKNGVLSSNEEIVNSLNNFQSSLNDMPNNNLVNMVSALPTIIITPIIFVFVYIVLGIILKIPKLILERILFGPNGGEEYRGGNRPIGGACGAVRVLLSVVVLLIPFIGFVNLAGSTIDILSQAEGTEGIQEINSDYIDTIRNNVAVKVVYNCGGKFMFKTLSTVKAGGIKISLTNEVETGAKIFTHVGAFTDTAPEEYGDRQIEEIDEITEIVKDAQLIPAILAESLSYASNSWLNGKTVFGYEKPDVGEYYNDTLDEILALFKNMSVNSVKRDVETIAAIGKESIKSGLIKGIITQDGIVEIVSSEDFLNNVLLAIYDNENMRPVLPMISRTMVNYMYKVYDEVNGTNTLWPEPVDIANISRAEIATEGTYISIMIKGILDFEESISDVDRVDTALYVKTAKVEALGKALDALHKSVFFGNSYEFMVRTILRSDICMDMKIVDDNLINTALNAKIGMEEFLVAMQQTAIVNLYLDNNDDVSREEYQKALRDLIMNSTHDKTDAMSSSLSKDKFHDLGMNNEKADAMARILSDLLESSANVNGTLSEAEMQKETDAVDKLLSAMMSSKDKESDENLFAADGENGSSGMTAEEFISNIIDSEILSQTVKASSTDENGNTKDDAYGIASSLTEADKESAREALNNYETEDRATLDAIAAILGLNH